MNDLYALLAARRSVRRYAPEPLDRQNMDRLICAALLAPSSRDIKPWELIVVEDKDDLCRISESKAYGAAFLKDAAAGVVVLGNPELSDVWVEDAALVSFLLHLAAVELGLGSCWIQIRNRTDSDRRSSSDRVREILRVPPPWEVESVIAVGGYVEGDRPLSVERAGEAPRPSRDLKSKVHWNRF